jgi:hypothetical protein
MATTSFANGAWPYLPTMCCREDFGLKAVNLGVDMGSRIAIVGEMMHILHRVIADRDTVSTYVGIGVLNGAGAQACHGIR